LRAEAGNRVNDPNYADKLNAAAERLSEAADRIGGGEGPQVQNMGRQPPVVLQN